MTSGVIPGVDIDETTAAATHRGAGPAGFLPRQPQGRRPQPQDRRRLSARPPGLLPLVSRVPGDGASLGVTRPDRPDELPEHGVCRAAPTGHGQPSPPGTSAVLPLGSGSQILKADPGETVKSVRVTKRGRPQGLEEPEVHALLRVAGESGHGHARRNYALVQFLLQTGLRISEAAASASPI